MTLFLPDIFIAVIVSATEIGKIRPSNSQSETVSKIHEVAFYCLTSGVWDDFNAYDTPGPSYPDQTDAILRDAYSQPNSSSTSLVEHPCSPLSKIISAGTFYYASEPYWDLSSRLSHRQERDSDSAKDLGTYDERFVWNEYIVRTLLDFRDRLDAHEREELDQCQFIVSYHVMYIINVNNIVSGSRHSRLCRCIHSRITCTTNEWCSNSRNNSPDFTSGVETCRHAIQYPWRRRRRKLC